MQDMSTDRCMAWLAENAPVASRGMVADLDAPEVASQVASEVEALKRVHLCRPRFELLTTRVRLELLHRERVPEDRDREGDRARL